MKKLKILVVMLICFTCVLTINKTYAQPGVSVNVDFNTFYNDLSPYGRWVDDGQYGRVWVYNEPGFRPYYTNGHWEYTDYGWSWVSDYDWGWGPFHYGRWEEDQELGWIWIPGYEWAPAWVSWSQTNGYYGWAPLGYGLGLDIGISSIPYNRWCFLPCEYITYSNFYNYAIPFERNRYYIRNSVVINNIYQGGGRGRFFMGPERGEVERYTHERIQPRNIQQDPRFGFRGRRDNENAYRGNNGREITNGRINNNSRSYNDPRNGYNDPRNLERQRNYRQENFGQQMNRQMPERNNVQPPQQSVPQQQQRYNGPGRDYGQRMQRTYNGNQGNSPRMNQSPPRNFGGGQVPMNRQYGGGTPAPRSFNTERSQPQQRSEGGGHWGGRRG